MRSLLPAAHRCNRMAPTPAPASAPAPFFSTDLPASVRITGVHPGELANLDPDAVRRLAQGGRL